MCDNLGINDEKMNVYFLKTEPYPNSWIAYTKDQLLHTLKDDIDNICDGDIPLEFTISMKVMTVNKFENLPEFNDE